MTASTLVAGVRQALGAWLPFSLMREDDLDFVARRVELAYFAPGEVVIAPDSGPPGACWIVRQGVVEGFQAGDSGDSPAVALSPGESFPVGALMADRGVTVTYRAAGDVFCWTLAKADFDELLRRSEVFLDFAKRRTAALLDLSRQALQASYAQQATQWRSMAAPVGELVRREAVTVRAEASLREVFETMERERVGSVIVGDAAGIFTRQDVVGRVVLPGVPLETPISAVMTAPVLTIEANATVAEAMLMMVERTIRHLPVRREDRLLGVLTERDLFVLQRQSLRSIGDAIAAAGSVADLARAAQDIRAWSSSLVAQGVTAAFATRLISRLNDQLTARLVMLRSAELGIAFDGACWLALGSEGREEQTIATDQDNGLVLADDATDARRDALLAFADSVNRSLDACGYPSCKGGIMAGNPRWCLRVSEWRTLFDGWIDRGDPESLLASSVFFDFRSLAGDAGLAAALRAHVTDRAASNPRFLKQMSDNAMRNGPPGSWSSGLLGQLFSAESPGIDLKLNGTVPFVDGARVLALAHRIPHTGTAARLEALQQLGVLPEAEVREWVQAFQFLQGLRLRVQHARQGQPDNPNLIDVRTLSDLDRRILKEAFRQARTLQQRLALDYPG